MNGIINVLKPPGMTSHDIVSFIRKTFNIKRVGHTGTLDPNAAGVLPICIGKATRVVEYFDDFTKIYRAELTLGYETDTQDKYGEIIDRMSIPNITSNEIEEVLDGFKGKTNQIPPMYSALKHNGRKLYELAREGKTVERKPREIVIHNISMLRNYDNKRILFDVECSKGTYIRTLCKDIGRKLGTLGCMTFLLRTQVGDFSIDNAYTIEEIQEYTYNSRLDSIIMPLDNALRHYSSINIHKNYYNILKNGGKIQLNYNSLESNFHNVERGIRVYCDDLFIGMGLIEKSSDNTILKMDKVFI
ncbi:tRNA pseudouridine(55) synthase TruB [Proteiniborus sp. MB09-C3]|uniref:tRNA pseudouridine(55) synthase TruB n=1 Tax=Proteiniborus sp. MB09-C3 TaxID=3050072 RepID=UPI002555E257|nr:tRNA pseudouridine(55) synthase TruB [Proteiniborus sp. MB09-C3]WIV10905.1 tRNA pseudouridine(55) synthase TruB [Proteiniborus sp. MB09-C3]